MDLNKKIEEIIPINDHEHRNEFSNSHLINQLNEHEKKVVEDALIAKLQIYPEDTLIIETLSYMHSTEAVPDMLKSLEKCEIGLQKIIIASAIFNLTKQDEMTDVALAEFKKLSKKWDLVFAFSYLSLFRDDRINNMIKDYCSNPDFLISYNAKEALKFID
ncbi:hypothetical protein [uncultured Mucilaginibacter sp.]|uniref:hypothetical protein n=3 Tax=uncultured Mucilaginibacter sp. TaxID=797541 RepID=UPI0025D92EF5|nr:hypothetical protein [uncultured Mucilaginibacter sp.]